MSDQPYLDLADAAEALVDYIGPRWIPLLFAGQRDREVWTNLLSALDACGRHIECAKAPSDGSDRIVI